MDQNSAPQASINNDGRSLKLTQSCRDLALVFFNTQLEEMFSQVEPAMLDFAEKAESNRISLRFSESIVQIKANRELVEHQFREEINRGFREFAEGKPISYPISLVESQDEGELALVDDSDLEEHLALQKIVSKANSRWYQDLFALRRRMAMLRGGRQLDEFEIPAGPAHATSSFQVAAQDFELDRDLLLVVYALFEKFVLGEAGTLYELINSRLVDAGIFPNLKLELPANPHGTQTAASEAAGSEVAEEPGSRPTAQQPSSESSLGEELFHSIRDMMSVRRRQNPVYANHPEFNPSAAPVTMVAKPQLVSAIAQIQPVESASYLPQAETVDDLPESIEIDQALIQQIHQTLVQEREKLFQEVDVNSIPSADLDTIELVGMLFEHVLNEDDLSNLIKALISHLHTPYLKIAILDHHFLIEEEHVARKLLNLLVEGGRKWVDEENLQRGAYLQMQKAVNRVLREFKEDVKLLDEVYLDLQREIAEQQKRAELVEQRTREAAKGRDRLESARARAQAAVEKEVGDIELSLEAERFLLHAWLDKIILMMLRNAEYEQGPQWQTDMELVRMVVNGCRAQTDPAARVQLLQNLPRIHALVEEGLGALGEYHQPDADRVLKFLEQVVDPDYQPRAAVAATPADQATAQQKRKQRRKRPLGEKELKALARLKQIGFGTWFELQDTSQHWRRLKLSWYSPVTQKYMFVDRTGVQALIIPVETLARNLCNGKAKILRDPKIPFVDRALQAIRSVLSKALGLQAAT